MSYIGVQSQNQISPQFSREVINGDGSATQFTLIQDVPGFNADNIMVVVNNVIQEPVAAYTIKEDANGNPRVLDFGAGNVLSTTDECYVQHRGVGTLNMTPAAGSVNAAALQDNLRSGNVDSFTATAGQTAFTLTETPLNAQSISVFVNGIYQKPTTNFTVSGTTLTLTAGAVAGDEIDVIHHTIRTTVTHVADGSVTSGKLDTNIQVAGTLGVTGNVTASADLSVAGNLTVSGTTTTIDTTVENVDKLEVGANSSDYGAKINQAGSGNILQLQDGGVDKVVVADGGNTTFSGNVIATGNIQVDDIVEKSTGHGVEIEQVTLKDGNATISDNIQVGSTAPVWPSANKSIQMGNASLAEGSDGYYHINDNLYYDSGSDARWEFVGNGRGINIYFNDGNVVFRRTTNSNSAGAGAQASSTLVNNAILGNDGNLTVSDGNLVFGGSGHGIDFSNQTPTSATGASNTSEVLDHYEEGTWTPVCSGSSGSTGVYTRIGRIVNLNGYITSTNNTGTSSVPITGLPFPVADLISATGHEAQGSISHHTAFNSGKQVIAVVAQDVGRLDFRLLSNIQTQLAYNDHSGTWQIRFSITYTTT